MREKMKIKPCPFCGEPFHIYEEGDCGAHPGETWFSVTHSCTVEVEKLQKGGTKAQFIKELNRRIKMELYDKEYDYYMLEDFMEFDPNALEDMENLSEDIPLPTFIELLGSVEDLVDIYPEYKWVNMVDLQEEPEEFGFYASIIMDLFCCYITYEGQISHMWVAQCDKCDDGLLEETCSRCNGSGEGCADETTCDSCGGSGVQVVSCSCPLGLKHN